MENTVAISTKMKYLPICMNLQDKPVVIFGGGKVGYEKAKILTRYATNIKVISKEFDKRFYKLHNITLIQKKIDKNDFHNDYSFVVSATNDELLNKTIYKYYSKKNIPINVVDQPHLCNVIFPAILEKKDITFAISTNGKVPGFSRYLKQCLKKWIPSYAPKILVELSKWRNKLKEKIQDHRKRMKIIRKILKKYDFLSIKYQKEPFNKIKNDISEAFKPYL